MKSRLILIPFLGLSLATLASAQIDAFSNVNVLLNARYSLKTSTKSLNFVSAPRTDAYPLQVGDTLTDYAHGSEFTSIGTEAYDTTGTSALRAGASNIVSVDIFNGESALSHGVSSAQLSFDLEHAGYFNIDFRVQEDWAPDLSVGGSLQNLSLSSFSLAKEDGTVLATRTSASVFNIWLAKGRYAISTTSDAKVVGLAGTANGVFRTNTEYTIAPTATPEPISAIALLSFGAVACRRRRRA